jgi:pantoate--beta-alanine ligase
MMVTEIIDVVRQYLDSPRRRRERIGLVPTMGALHDGHRSLIRRAREECDFVVVSIFVNPTQFGPNEDLDRYPRTLEKDLEICEAEGVDLVFTPSAKEMYPDESFIRFEIDTLTKHLCGASRPGHFNGVLQVVNKFLQIVEPHDAYFGQKDIQQFMLIKRLVQEFNIRVTVQRVETIREHDGLALSSRNRYLSDADRKIAPELYRNLQLLHQIYTEKTFSDRLEIQKQLHDASASLSASGLKIDYLEIVDSSTLQPVESISDNTTYIIAGAVFLGNTRLIDNIILER